MPRAKRILLLLIIIHLQSTTFLFAAPTEQKGASFAIVELYTSEGCSSCPPADLLLRQLTENARKEKLPVYTLSFHVDYWNRLGWEDPFSQAQFTERQRHYAKVNRSSNVYTPQFIINGESAFAGYRFDLLEKTISGSLKTKASASVNLEIERLDKETLDLHYAVESASRNDLLQVAVVERNLKIPILHGENAGKTLEHDNVVRILKTVTVGKGEGQMKLTLLPSINLANSSVIAYVQNAKTMAITGATAVDLK